MTGVLDTLLDHGPVQDAADSLQKASTPEPFSTSKTSNWVARAGGLPPYIQHIAHDIAEKRGKSVSNAIQIAIGVVKNWASGQGKVDATTRAAASKAVAQWEAMKAKNAAKGAGKAAVQHSAVEPSFADERALLLAAEERLGILEAQLGSAGVRGLLEELHRKVKCPKCDTVQSATNKSCTNCGHSLGAARAAKFAKTEESLQALDALAELAAFDVITLGGVSERTADEWVQELAIVCRAVEGPGSGPLAEAFDTALHPHVLHGPGGGEFRKVLGAGSATRSAVRVPRIAQHGETALKNTANARAESAKLASAHKFTEEELPHAVGRGSWSGHVSAAVGALQKGHSFDTEQHYRQKDKAGKMGAYHPDRVALHNRIIHALLQGAGQHDRPEAHFLAGGPASGKSSLQKSGKLSHPKDAVLINPDVIKEMLPEYGRLRARGDKTASSRVHEESSHISKLATNIALQRKHHVVIDSVGNNEPGKFRDKLLNARDHGHKVHVDYATLPVDLARKLADVRAQKTGRNVPEGYLRSAHAGVSREYEQNVSKLKGVSVKVYDTSKKNKPKLISSKTAEARAVRIHEKHLHELFLRKGHG